MTVHELIEQLQQCDMPDAEVRVEGSKGVATSRVTEVYYAATDGPVFIYADAASIQEVK